MSLTSGTHEDHDAYWPDASDLSRRSQGYQRRQAVEFRRLVRRRRDSSECGPCFHRWPEGPPTPILALAECVAYAAGDWATDEVGSFLKRASAHLEDMKVQLVWADGSRSQARLGDPQPDESRVRYLSQKFVERLCADDHIGTELVKEIEAVIFSYIDPTDTLNASSFDQANSIRTFMASSEEGNSMLEKYGMRFCG